MSDATVRDIEDFEEHLYNGFYVRLTFRPGTYSHNRLDLGPFSEEGAWQVLLEVREELEEAGDGFVETGNGYIKVKNVDGLSVLTTEQVSKGGYDGN